MKIVKMTLDNLSFKNIINNKNKTDTVKKFNEVFS